MIPPQVGMRVCTLQRKKIERPKKGKAKEKKKKKKEKKRKEKNKMREKERRDNATISFSTLVL